MTKQEIMTILNNIKPYGEKYDGNIIIVEITKMIRLELKNLTKLGFKFSVRHRDFSAITIKVLKIPKDFVINNPYYDQQAAWELQVGKGNGFEVGKDPRPVYTENGLKLSAYLRSIGNQWNFDKSDIQTDYFHNNYFLFVINTDNSTM